MELVKSAEKELEKLFKGAPQLSDKTRETLANIWPWIALVFGILQLWAAFALWGLFSLASNLANEVNTLSIYATGKAIQFSAFDRLVIYLGIAMLIAEGVLFLVAFPKLRKRQAAGWNLMFIAALLNVAYSVVSIFERYRGFGYFILGLIGTAIGFWLLFQVKGKFTKTEKSV